MVLDDKMHGGYHAIIGEPVEASPQLTEFFIGKFQRDGLYHLLGERPARIEDGRQMFSEGDENHGDHGVVTLPAGKTSLRQCARGDILTVTPQLPDAKPYQITYLSHSG